MKNHYNFSVRILVFILFFITSLTATNVYADAPTSPSTNLSVSNLDGDRFYVSFTRGNGTRRIIVASTSAVTAVPKDGTDYLAGNFGLGNELAPGQFVVYNGTASNIWIAGLSPSTTYRFKIFEYNGTDFNTEYLTTEFLEGTGTTISAPTVQAGNLIFSNVIGSSMTVNWAAGNGSGRILVARADEPVNVEPQDLANYNPWAGAFASTNSVYSIGTQEHKVLYMGNGSGVSVTNLDPNRTYHFAIFEYNGSNGKVYLRPGSTGSQLTASAPTGAASNFTVNNSNVDGDRFYYSFTSGNGARRIVIAKKGSPVTAVPENKVSYTHNVTFGSGTEIKEGEFVVYNGTSNQSWLNGLEPATTYHLAVFEYNGTGSETFYLTNPFLAGSRATLSSPTVQSNNAFTSSRSNTSINISWTRGDGTQRILIGRKDGPVNIEPEDLTNYSTTSTFGTSWTQIGMGNYGLYVGNGNNANITNLESGTNYHFALFEYNGSSGKLYLRPGYQFALETFGERPTVQVSGAQYSNIDFSSFDVSFTKGNGSRRLVLAREGSAVSGGPADFTSYTASNIFGQGQQIGTGAYVVYNGPDEEFKLEGLETGKTYHFAFYEYSLSESGPLYRSPAYTSTQSTKAIADLGISQIKSPISGCNLSDQETIIIDIKNNSPFAAGAFRVAYSVNGGELIIENISGTNSIAANGTLTHTFQTKVDLSNKGIYSIEAFVLLDEDTDEGSNSIKVSIENYAEPVTTITENSTISEGQSILLEASGGASYKWNSGATSSSITVAPTITTEYTVEITDENGCKVVRSVTVDVVMDPCQELICPPGEVCSGGECVPIACETSLGPLQVSPELGTRETDYTFTIIYTDPNNTSLAQGYPRLELDANNNGSAEDSGDLIYVMSEIDPSDTDLTNGKTFQVSVSGLSETIAWKSRVVTQNEFNCQSNTAFIVTPNVTASNLDVAIFANNISFSNDNPNINETITIFARIRNISDFPAENFVVSAYDGETQIFTTVINRIEPRSNFDISWNYSFDKIGFYPIKVVIDETDVLKEINELNNFAIRPVVVGDYILPGGIQSTITTNTATAFVGGLVSISGYASYFGIDEGVNPDVAGANVTVNYENGSFQTTTNSNGTFARSIRMPNTPGIYTFTGSVTDYTLTGEIPTFQVEVIPHPDKADLVANISINKSGVLQGEEITGIATVSNIGKLTANNFIFQYSSCEESLGEVTIISLAPGESRSFNFAVKVSKLGNCLDKDNCLFTAIADGIGSVDDKNRENNYAFRAVTVYPPLPDLTPIFSRLGNKPSDVEVKVNNIGGRSVDSEFDVNVYLDDVLVDSRNFASLQQCGQISYIVKVDLTGGENQIIRIKVDEPLGSGKIVEFNEDNNEKVLSYSPPPLIPNLLIRNSNLSVDPVFPGEGENFIIKARVLNDGNAPIESFEVNFQIVEDGVVRNEVINVTEGLASGAAVVLEYPAMLATYGKHSVLVDLDPLNLIVERSEFDNKASMPLCLDFEAIQSGPVWQNNIFANTPQTLSGRVKNLGLFTATGVQVDFLLDGTVIGSTIIPQISPSFNTSGIPISIPYTFIEEGSFLLEMVVDPNNKFPECDKENNITSKTIVVRPPQPDLRILSEYISPTKLNPDANEEIDLFVSFDNIGSTTTIPFKIRVTVNDVPLGEDILVEGLGEGKLNTVAIQTPYSSPTSGIKVIRGFVDVERETDDANYKNNEASRVIIVGEAPNLFFTKIDFSTQCPQVGDQIQINVDIENEGGLGSNAEVHFYYLTETDTVPIDIVPISVNLKSSISTSINWTVINSEYSIFAEIKNSDPQEYNELDNWILAEFSDTTLPTSITQNITVYLNETGVVEIAPEQIDNGSFNNCGIAEMTLSQSNFDCSMIGDQVVILTVRDFSGNESSAEAVVTVMDNINPIITAPANLTIILEENETVANGVTLGTPETSDNCEVESIVNNAPTSYPLGETIVTWTVEDNSGNKATATQKVTVTAEGLPTITAPADISANTDAGSCSAVISNLGSPATTGQISNGNISNDAPESFPLGTTTVTWTATDDYGNTVTATQQVTVTDNENPTITAPANVSVTLAPGTSMATGVNLGTPATADNCGVKSTTNNAPVSYPLGETIVTWTVEDNSGNKATATQKVTVSAAAQECSPAQIIAITEPNGPVRINTAIKVSALVNGKVKAAQWNWGDGKVTNLSGPFIDFEASHTYTATGTYTITFTVTDDCDVKHSLETDPVQISDPNGGFVIGAGWINSPRGGFTNDPQDQGPVHFGFIAKYRRNSPKVEGTTMMFQLRKTNLAFIATSLTDMSLVVEGNKAIFRGEGMLNRQPGYAFLISVIDGDMNKKKAPDTFRIKIWRKSDGLVVYDNQRGAVDHADAVNSIAAGQIVILHQNQGRRTDGSVTGSQALHVPWNTPFDKLLNTYQDDLTLGSNVDWDLTAYDPLTPGYYVVNGKGKDQDMAIHILVENKEKSTGIELSQTQVGNNLKIGEEVAKINTIDAADDQHTYSLDPEYGNSKLFTIQGNRLIWMGENKPESMDIRIISMDRAGQEIAENIMLSREKTRLQDLNIPNTFTPNSDGANDTWGIPETEALGAAYTISVYDRGGKLLFSTQDSRERWDGTHNGKQVPVGTYFYVIGDLDSKTTRRGVLNLLKR